MLLQILLQKGQPKGLGKGHVTVQPSCRAGSLQWVSSRTRESRKCANDAECVKDQNKATTLKNNEAHLLVYLNAYISHQLHHPQTTGIKPGPMPLRLAALSLP